jgi:hypothetical protein
MRTFADLADIVVEGLEPVLDKQAERMRQVDRDRKRHVDHGCMGKNKHRSKQLQNQSSRHWLTAGKGKRTWVGIVDGAWVLVVFVSCLQQRELGRLSGKQICFITRPGGIACSHRHALAPQGMRG